MKTNLHRCLTLFYVFAGISAVALGGGLVMLPVMTREFVDKRKWMTHEEMLDTVAIMQSLPGIISVNMASLIGGRIAGVPGAVFSVVGVVLPPFFTILAVILCLKHVFDTPAMANIFSGVRAAVCALILLSVLDLARKALKGSMECLLAVIGFIAMLFFNVNAIWLIVFGAVAGIVWQAVRSFRSSPSKSHEANHD